MLSLRSITWVSQNHFVLGNAQYLRVCAPQGGTNRRCLRQRSAAAAAQGHEGACLDISDTMRLRLGASGFCYPVPTGMLRNT